MKLKPILFSTPMVQAILEGRKTQTRRICKPQPNTHFRTDNRLKIVLRNGNYEFVDKMSSDGFSILDSIKPKYQPGDILWVRETWKPGAWREDGRVAFDYKASPEITNTPWVQFSNF